MVSSAQMLEDFRENLCWSGECRFRVFIEHSRDSVLQGTSGSTSQLSKLHEVGPGVESVWRSLG
jgi:hypothetical protein